VLYGVGDTPVEIFCQMRRVEIAIVGKPPRQPRRLFGLSQAAIAVSSSDA
jgi:hypothetical protein